MLGFLLLFAGFLAVLPAAAQCAPESMVRIEFRNLSPGTDPDSFDALSKVFYRQGAGLARWEEPKDTVNNMQALVVVHGKDTWMADLVAKTGSHFVKQAGDPPLAAPVIAVQGFPQPVYAIELGCEVAYMQSQGITPKRIQVQGLDYDEFTLAIPPLEARLLVRPDKNTPSALALYEGEVLRHLVQYRSYEVGLTLDEALFSPPGEIQWGGGS